MDECKTLPYGITTVLAFFRRAGTDPRGFPATGVSVRPVAAPAVARALRRAGVRCAGKAYASNAAVAAPGSEAAATVSLGRNTHNYGRKLTLKAKV